MRVEHCAVGLGYREEGIKFNIYFLNQQRVNNEAVVALITCMQLIAALHGDVTSCLLATRSSCRQDSAWGQRLHSQGTKVEW